MKYTWTTKYAWTTIGAMPVLPVTDKSRFVVVAVKPSDPADWKIGLYTRNGRGTVNEHEEFFGFFHHDEGGFKDPCVKFLRQGVTKPFETVEEAVAAVERYIDVVVRLNEREHEWKAVTPYKPTTKAKRHILEAYSPDGGTCLHQIHLISGVGVEHGYSANWRPWDDVECQVIGTALSYAKAVKAVMQWIKDVAAVKRNEGE